MMDTTGHIAAVRLKSANKYIFRALLSLASANLLIRAAGLVNQVVVTYRFGQGASMDAYFVASAIPTLLAQLLATALEASVIPVYTSNTHVKAERSGLDPLQHVAQYSGDRSRCSYRAMLLLRGQVVFLSASGLSHQSPCNWLRG